jgi:hypothetical protein
MSSLGMICDGSSSIDSHSRLCTGFGAMPYRFWL